MTAELASADTTVPDLPVLLPNGMPAVITGRWDCTATLGRNIEMGAAKRKRKAGAEVPVTYVQTAMAAVAAEMPGRQDGALVRLYTLLALTKGAATTMEDVHDAFSLWLAESRPGFPPVVPFAGLPPEIAELDRPFMEAIHRAAAVLGGA